MEFGRPYDGEDLAEFVLCQINDRTLFDIGIRNAADAVCEAITNGIDSAMNKFN